MGKQGGEKKAPSSEVVDDEEALVARRAVIAALKADDGAESVLNAAVSAAVPGAAAVDLPAPPVQRRRPSWDADASRAVVPLAFDHATAPRARPISAAVRGRAAPEAAVERGAVAEWRAEAGLVEEATSEEDALRAQHGLDGEFDDADDELGAFAQSGVVRTGGAAAFDPPSFTDSEDEDAGGSEEDDAAVIERHERAAQDAAVGGAASAERTRNEREAKIVRAMEKKHVEQCEVELEWRIRDCEVADQQTRKARAKLREVDAEVGELQRRLDEMGGANAGTVGDQRRKEARALADKIKIKSALVRAHQESVEKADEAFEVALRDRSSAESRVRANAEMADRLKREAEQDLKEARILARHRQRQEEKHEQRQQRRRQQEAAAAREAELFEAERTRFAVEQSKVLRRDAVRRLREAQAVIDENAAAAEAGRKAMLERRAKAVNELKKSTTAAANKIQVQTKRRQKAQKQLDAKHEAERDAILAAGGNPYEVWRRRAVEERAAAELEAQRQAAKEKELDVLRTMAEVEEREKSQVAKAAEDRKVGKQFQREMGIEAQRERTEKYMQALTQDGKGIIDPNSKKRHFLPSQFTTVKSAKFGLGGKVDPELLEKIKAKYPKGTFDEAALIRMATSNPAAVAQGEQLARTRGTAAADKAASAMVVDEDEDEDAEEVFVQPTLQGTWHDVAAGASKASAAASAGKKDAAPVRKAPRPMPMGPKATAKAGGGGAAGAGAVAGATQIVNGREFKGQAFISKPAVIEFLDFELGKTYTQKVVVTNVSFTINTFKVGQLADAVRDFFDVDYKPPGAMSAGLTCTLTITFTPKRLKDLDDSLPLIAQTGPIGIPIRCRFKKVALSVHPAQLDFGGVTLGESGTLQLRIKNDGGTRTRFTITYPKEDGGDAETAGDGDGEGEGEGEGENGGEGICNGSDGEQSADGSDDSFMRQFGDDEIELPDEFDLEKLQLTYRDRDNGPDLQTAVDGYFSARDTNRSSAGLSFRSALGDGADADEMDEAGPLPLWDGQVAEGISEPYSTTVVEVYFSPRTTNDVRAQLQVHFEHSQARDTTVEMIGCGEDVPIFVPREVIDLNTCYNDVLYRDVLVIENRGKTTLKCQIEEAPELRQFVQFTPRVGFVQANSTFNVQIKFRPRPGILQDIGKFADLTTGLIEVPILINVPDQVMPVYFMFRARMTSSSLRLTPSEIDFRRCSIRESVSVPFQLRNLSSLPQEFGFVNLPKQLKIEPGDGFGTLLPHETRDMTIVFSPNQPMDYAFTAVCKTLLGRAFTVKCSGVGYTPLASFDQGRLTLPATALGNKRGEYVMLRNDSRQELLFEMAAPADSDLVVAPLIGRLPVGAGRRVFLEYAPTATVIRAQMRRRKRADLERRRNLPGGARRDAHESFSSDEETAYSEYDTARTGGDGDASVDDASGDASATVAPGAVVDRLADIIAPMEDGTPWCFTNHLFVPCFLRPVDADASYDPAVVYLQVETAAVEPYLSVVSPATGEKVHELDFGAVAVSNSAMLTLRLVNHGSKDADVALRPLHPNGSFLVVNSMRPVPANGHHDVLVKFTPRSAVNYVEMLDLVGLMDNDCQVKLRGVGIEPDVVLEPNTDELDMGDVLAGTRTSKQVTLVNNSPFDIHYSVQLAYGGPANYNRTAVFDVVPCQAVVPRGGKQELTVTFQPDHECADFADQVDILLPGHRLAGIRMGVCGRGWRRGVYALAPRTADALLAPATAGGAARGSSAAYDAIFQSDDVPDVEEMMLAFSRPGTQSVTVGSVLHGETGPGRDERGGKAGGKAGGGGGGGSAEFVVEPLAPEDMALGFGIVATRGAVDAAGKAVEFTFEPTPAVLAAHRGQWLECRARLVIKGGNPPPPTASGWVFDVILRGYGGDIV